MKDNQVDLASAFAERLIAAYGSEALQIAIRQIPDAPTYNIVVAWAKIAQVIRIKLRDSITD